ncbi:MAG: hypothetical protein R3228_01880 [Halioglobus sp.]|nr:hypothetical protein [Halioglobus sp.]
MAELGLRWRTMFGALAAGEDVSPALRLRTEGMMEAALLLGTDRGRLVAAMCECYRAAFGRSIEDDFGDDWEAFFPFPQIPAMARRAPVYPTTRD